MARVSKFVVLFGAGLSMFAVMALALGIAEKVVPHIAPDRRENPASFVALLYLLGVFILSKSRSRAAGVALAGIATAGYISLVAFLVWVFGGTSN